MLFEGSGIGEHFNAFCGRLDKVMVAPGTDAEVLLELEVVYQLRARCALLPETGRQFTLLI
jgi:hypothetical protein